jgi:hypothetical protein
MSKRAIRKRRHIPSEARETTLVVLPAEDFDALIQEVYGPDHRVMPTEDAWKLMKGRVRPSIEQHASGAIAAALEAIRKQVAGE